MSDDLYTRWLKIPPGRRPPAPHLLLNVPEDVSDQQQIEEAAHRQLQMLDQYAAYRDPDVRQACAQMMNEVATARNLLIGRLTTEVPASPAPAYQDIFGEMLFSRLTATAHRSLKQLMSQKMTTKFSLTVRSV